jgi:hypothetical protein
MTTFREQARQFLFNTPTFEAVLLYSVGECRARLRQLEERVFLVRRITVTFSKDDFLVHWSERRSFPILIQGTFYPQADDSMLIRGILKTNTYGRVVMAFYALLAGFMLSMFVFFGFSQISDGGACACIPILMVAGVVAFVFFRVIDDPRTLLLRMEQVLKSRNQ